MLSPKLRAGNERPKEEIESWELEFFTLGSLMPQICNECGHNIRFWGIVGHRVTARCKPCGIRVLL